MKDKLNIKKIHFKMEQFILYSTLENVCTLRKTEKSKKLSEFFSH